jgi:GNAT superfamily N-acetyltransferase
MIERKEYIVDEKICLRPIKNDESVLKDYIIKMHNHHNSLDNISPVKNIDQFEKTENSVFWLIYYENKIIGFINLFYREQCIENMLEIHRIYVDDEYRGYGVGSKIIDLLKTLAKENGYNGITAMVYCNNPAINFYESNGFETYYRYMFTKV